jgi:hypothetical protein
MLASLLFSTVQKEVFGMGSLFVPTVVVVLTSLSSFAVSQASAPL